MRAFYCKQRTHEWFKLRAGRITASRIVDVLAKLQPNKDGTPNKKEAADRITYRKEVRAERLTGSCEDHPVNKYMEWGASEEDKARDFYEQHFEVMTHPVGFVIHPQFDFSGASPDSLVGEDGGLEIKCFKTTNHLEILETKQIPEDCLPQLYWNMECAEREFWDFMSFDSRIKNEKMRAFVVRLYRDEKRIAEIRTEVQRFHEEVERMIAALGAMALPFYEPAPEPTSAEMLRELMNDMTEIVP